MVGVVGSRSAATGVTLFAVFLTGLLYGTEGVGRLFSSQSFSILVGAVLAISMPRAIFGRITRRPNSLLARRALGTVLIVGAAASFVGTIPTIYLVVRNPAPGEGLIEGYVLWALTAANYAALLTTADYLKAHGKVALGFTLDTGAIALVYCILIGLFVVGGSGLEAAIPAAWFLASGIALTGAAWAVRKDVKRRGAWNLMAVSRLFSLSLWGGLLATVTATRLPGSMAPLIMSQEEAGRLALAVYLAAVLTTVNSIFGTVYGQRVAQRFLAGDAPGTHREVRRLRKFSTASSAVFGVGIVGLYLVSNWFGYGTLAQGAALSIVLVCSQVLRGLIGPFETTTQILMDGVPDLTGAALAILLLLLGAAAAVWAGADPVLAMLAAAASGTTLRAVVNGVAWRRLQVKRVA